MIIWWRNEPFSKEDKILMDSCVNAHLKSAFRENASSMAVANAAGSSCDMAKAIAAGLLTLGGRHAPVEHTHKFLSMLEPDREVRRILKAGHKVPGWGGTFQKEHPDPLWEETHKALREIRPDLGKKLDNVTAELFRNEKYIQPNPSAYTAAVAIALGLDAKTAVYIFISARLDAWAKIAAKYLG